MYKHWIEPVPLARPGGERGARPGDLVALLAATGAQTETIPPSLVLITIGSVTGVSISALFTGGLLPGVVLAAMLCALVWWRSRGEEPATQWTTVPVTRGSISVNVTATGTLVAAPSSAAAHTRVAELADAPDSKSGAFGRVGSIPTFGIGI